VTAYQVGKRFEDKVRDHLREEGYEVIRSAGSKTKVDVIAMKPGQQLLVQCKRDGVCGPAEWDRLFEIAGWVGAVPVLAVNGPRGRGVAYWRLTARKLRGRGMAAQPAESFLTDEAWVHPGVRQEWVEVQ
jgi:Holliday junction resolvase